MREENVTLSHECSTLRNTLKELMNENETLKTSLAEARTAERAQAVVETSAHVLTSKDLNHSPSDSFDNFPLNNSPIAPFSFAPPQNSISPQQEMSLKRLAYLENEAMRCTQLEEQIRKLEKSLKVLTTQYNELLEVDGERLERIEELEHDVTDLRQLLKDQVSLS
ncbi:unnamed protein product [Cylicostephanus goldi]|uniref:TATA element modulatory factor 1 TATA binding domain-containing protein n=1 Tax=Cylicostephanus goldi TaxID=71465 RepID=A0A3P6SAH3_CYLGO|nr:unnamed protein product [Cylicostephanus goldi]